MSTLRGVRSLSEGSIGRQLIGLALPVVGTSFMQMTYHLLSIFWVGRLGSQVVAAVAAVSMLMWLVSTLSLLSKISSEVGIGQSIGRKQLTQAKLFASHTMMLSLLFGMVIASFLALFSHQVLSFFHLSPNITLQASRYLEITTLAIPLFFISNTLSGIYNGCGRSSIPFKCNAVGLVVNIILDPILIFGWEDIPALGMLGAAYGTVISQCVVIGIYLCYRYQSDAGLGRFPLFVRPQKEYFTAILRLGSPVSFMSALYALINTLLARIAVFYNGHIGMVSQTTGGQIEAVSWNTAQGFSTALGAFVAQNFAARKGERILRAYAITLLIMGGVGLFISVVFMTQGDTLFGIFLNEEKAIVAGSEYLWVLGFSQIFMICELVTQGVFNGIGRTLAPAVVSITGNLLRIPLAYLFGSHLGVIGVWWAISITSILKGVVLPIYLLLVVKKSIRT